MKIGDEPSLWMACFVVVKEFPYLGNATYVSLMMVRLMLMFKSALLKQQMPLVV